MSLNFAVNTTKNTTK